MGLWDSIKGTVGSIIGAGSSIVGGMMSDKSREKAAKTETKYQKQFAQQGVRWKVADAKAAGLHPLAALGVNTNTYIPQRVGGSSLGRGISDAGQDIGRAISTSSTEAERKFNSIKLLQEEEVLKQLQMGNNITKRQLDELEATPPMPSITETNLQNDYQTHDEQLAARGVSRETQPTLTRVGTIRHYPSQQIMDLISESAIAATLFYKGSLNYATAMNKAHKMKTAKKHKDPLYSAYIQEKRKLEHKIGQRVEWASTSANTGSWIVSGGISDKLK